MDKHFTSITIHALYRAMLISLIEAEIYFLSGTGHHRLRSLLPSRRTTLIGSVIISIVS